MLGKTAVKKTKHRHVLSHVFMKLLQILFSRQAKCLILIHGKHPDLMHMNVFDVVPTSESNALEKAKSNCFTSAISMVKCLGCGMTQKINLQQWLLVLWEVCRYYWCCRWKRQRMRNVGWWFHYAHEVLEKGKALAQAQRHLSIFKKTQEETFQK